MLYFSISKGLCSIGIVTPSPTLEADVTISATLSDGCCKISLDATGQQNSRHPSILEGLKTISDDISLVNGADGET